MSIAWLDMCNAFGSVPQAILNELFTSLPAPEDLRRILVDIYSGNRMDFAVGKESIFIFPTEGVRQGDALSFSIFNLASEPLVRSGKSNINTGFLLFGSLVKTTAYDDDIAVVTNSPSELQNILNVFTLTANTLRLQFNAGKCACLVFNKGNPSDAQCRIGDQLIRCLGQDDQETYLDTLIGGKLRFRPFLESTEDPGVPSDSRPDWQRSRDQWIWCVPISIMVHQTPKLRITPLFP
ncbi:Uncharacterized protein APZ42_024982 [Daphnia magna]|uniref:Reverse transcriptase domain-containing protein n=1 Tax=Daphnia magna TaxID=35525 RepID=A0A164TKJ1_9CRUS|nr:Uncharacterized protein APZ42_024982 [Daphnia magna]